MRATKAVFFMRKDRPVARFLIGAVSGKIPGLRAFSMLMLGVSLLCATAMGAAPKGKTADTQGKAAASSDFVGSETYLTVVPTRNRGGLPGYWRAGVRQYFCPGHYRFFSL